MSLYNPAVPTGLIPLDQDYRNVQKNFSQANTSFGVDHVPFATTPNNGYHRTIRQIPRAAPDPLDPLPITGINQLYTKTVSGDTQLFAMTGDGGISQLTGYNANVRGWQYIGGVLLQWGGKSIPSGVQNNTVVVTFTDSGGIDFSSTPYNVQLCFITNSSPSSSSNAEIAVQGSLSSTGFTVRSNQNTAGAYPSFYWFCIGPA